LEVLVCRMNLLYKKENPDIEVPGLLVAFKG